MKFFNRFKGNNKTSLHSITRQTIEALSHAYKVDEDTVSSIVTDWMRFQRAVQDDTYD